jgi:hypothetical protein
MNLLACVVSMDNQTSSLNGSPVYVVFEDYKSGLKSKLLGPFPYVQLRYGELISEDEHGEVVEIASSTASELWIINDNSDQHAYTDLVLTTNCLSCDRAGLIANLREFLGRFVTLVPVGELPKFHQLMGTSTVSINDQPVPCSGYTPEGVPIVLNAGTRISER